MRTSNAIRGRSRAGFLAATAGVACAVALLPTAFLAPFYSGRSASPTGVVEETTSTLVEVNGLRIVGLLCVPVFLSVAAWVGLHLRSRGRALGGLLAWSAIGLLCTFALVGMLSIGLFVLPAAVLLIAAASLTSTRHAEAGTT